MWHLKPALLVGAAVASAFSLLAGGHGAPGGGVPVPARGRTARVVANAFGGMNTREEPRLDAPLVAANDAFSGTLVNVLATGISPTDGSGGEWWQIVTPGGSMGYARAVDPQGVSNFEDVRDAGEV
jgi:hypothetical protein